MDPLTFIILVIILCVVLFLVYYFFRGQKGNISLSRPVESRVDEYLDRRFQSMVEEWELVSHPRLASFKEQRTPEIEQDEARLLDLKNYESGMQAHLTSLEARLDTLEKELARKDNSKK
jgi:cell shape-determining protein MreC